MKQQLKTLLNRVRKSKKVFLLKENKIKLQAKKAKKTHIELMNHIEQSYKENAKKHLKARKLLNSDHKSIVEILVLLREAYSTNLINEQERYEIQC